MSASHRIRVGVVTGTRAEYGLLFWILKQLQGEPAIDLQLIVTGAHLSPLHGLTYRDIEADGVIYNRSILDGVTLKSSGFLYQAELLIKLIRAGYLYAETPHFLSRRGSGKTKALTIKSFLQITRGYLRLMWEVHVLRRTGFADAPIDSRSATYRRIRGQAAGS